MGKVIRLQMHDFKDLLKYFVKFNRKSLQATKQINEPKVSVTLEKDGFPTPGGRSIACVQAD